MDITVAGKIITVTPDATSPIDLSPVVDSAPEPTPAAHPGEDVPRGTTPYLETLACMHRILEPTLYLEIGVWLGNSLAKTRCPAIAIDPNPDIKVPLPPQIQMFRMTSDQFFAEYAWQAIDRPVDMAFIDGLHLLEFVLRDFMNVERYAGPGSLVVIDDAFPAHPVQASRHRRVGTWMGDVWKIHPILSQLRPDLFILPLDTWPSGLPVVAGLDPKNDILWHTYNQIVRQLSTDIDPPQAVLDRVGIYPPTTIEPLLDVLKSLRRNAASPEQSACALRALVFTI